ncbi:MAG: hypothetical protein H5T61_08280 [Thermoflexales bacterium]|nr:hypothetical protein [Thermoflexales bacterium]
MKHHLWTIILLILLTVLLLVGLGLTLRGKGVRMALIHRVRAIMHRGDIVRRGDFTDVIFLHHSVGRNLINQGGVRERLTGAGFRFWDHDYNWEGLTRPDGTLAGYSYGIPGDNTDPDGLARIFSQPAFPWPVNAFSGLLQHEVIIVKSCFPNSNIRSDEQLREMQGYYLRMRDRVDRFPRHLFIIVTSPPLNPAETTPEAAARARALSRWLQSEEFLAGHPNVAVFDLFGLLAEDDPAAPDFNMLRAEYREGTDSHPNRFANETMGPIFADFVIEVAHTYRARLAKQEARP